MTGVTKAARAVKYRTFSLAQIEEADARECGICLAYGALQDGREPDARKIRCDACKQHQIHGANDIMTMGLRVGWRSASVMGLSPIDLRGMISTLKRDVPKHRRYFQAFPPVFS